MKREIERLAQVEQGCDTDRIAHVWFRGCASHARVTRHSDVDRRMRAPKDRISERRRVPIGLGWGQCLHTGGAWVAVLVTDLLSNLFFRFSHLARIALHPVRCMHIIHVMMCGTGRGEWRRGGEEGKRRQTYTETESTENETKCHWKKTTAHCLSIASHTYKVHGT